MILYKKIFHSYDLAMKAFFFFLFFFSFLFTIALEAKECNLTSPLKVFKPQFAKHFTIEYFDKFKIAHANNHSYLLSGQEDLGCQFPMLKIKTPVKRVVMMSTTYLPALELIKKEQSLIAFQGKRYIVSSAFNQDLVKDVSFKINPENLLTLKADLIMGYDSNLTSDKQRQIFKALNLPVVINKDFEETSPLARAEWLIYIASFFDQEKLAQDIFNKISSDYLNLKKENAKISSKPKILIGDIQNGYWISSGGKSDLGQMITDAGAEMLFFRASAETQKISLEELSSLKTPVDFWLPHNMWRSHADLVAAQTKDSRYKLIKAKNIYNNNLITNKNNFNDYWEMGMQRPDLMLLDLTALFHPENHPNHKFHWYQQL